MSVKNNLRGKYLYWNKLIEEPLSGVDRKVRDWIDGLNGFGECSLELVERHVDFIHKVIESLPLTGDGHSWPNPESLADLDYIYIRRPRFISKDLRKFLHAAKKENPRLKTVLELPTYPYDKEMLEPMLFPAYLKDRFNRSRLQGDLDLIVTMADVTEVFGVKAVTVPNGINVSRLKARSPSYEGQQATIKIVCVAAFARWHGIDRFICGMRDYYSASASPRNMHLWLLGDGPELGNLKDLVKCSGLDGRVSFLGMCDRREMDLAFDGATLAIESLGCHRRGPRAVSSSLKSREYLAKGIPFIYSSPIDVIEGTDFDYALKLPEDDSPINIAEVLSFYDSIYMRESEERVITRIRRFALENVDISVVLKPLVDELR